MFHEKRVIQVFELHFERDIHSISYDLVMKSRAASLQDHHRIIINCEEVIVCTLHDPFS